MTTPRESDEGVALIGLVFETASGLRRFAGPKWEQDWGLPGQSFEILVRLVRAPGTRLRMSDLAARSSLTRSGLSRAVDRLNEAGLVVRESCDEDRRGAFARLTPQGRKKTLAALRCHQAEVEQLLDGLLERRERELLAAMLGRLRDGLSSRPCPRET